MVQPSSLACRLPAAAVPGRLREASALGAHLRRVHRHGPEHVELTFEAGAADRVRAFVRAESRCCPFFAFDLRAHDREVTLTVAAPPAGAPLLDALVEAFSSGSRAPR